MISKDEFYKSAHKLRKLSSRPDAVDLGRAEGSRPVAVLPVCLCLLSVAVVEVTFCQLPFRVLLPPKGVLAEVRSPRSRPRGSLLVVAEEEDL